MRLVSLATRNLIRNPIRSALTAAAVSFGLALMMWMVVIQTGQHRDMISTALETSSGYVVVQHAGYQSEMDSKLILEGSGAIATAIQTTLPQAVVLRRATLPGLLTSTKNNASAGLLALDQAAEAPYQATVADNIIAGAWGNTGRSSLVIGEKMATSLGVEVGDKVVYMGQHGTDDIESKLLRVGGIFRTGNADLDGFAAFADFTYLQSLMPGDDPAHQVSVQLGDTVAPENEAAVAALRDQIARALSDTTDTEVLAWMEALSDLKDFIEVDRMGNDIMFGFLSVVIFAGVFNTTVMSTAERTREIGVLMAIGMQPMTVLRLILLEATMLAVVAVALGLVLGSAISYPTIHYGIDFSAMVGGANNFEAGGVVVSSTILGAWNWPKVTVYTGLTVIFSALSAVYPAWSATRLSPVDAMRHH